MSTVIFGKDVVVQAKVDDAYITIGCADASNFTFVNEIIGKTDVNAGLFRKKRARISDCNGSVQGISISESSATRLSIFHFLQEGIRRSEIEMRFVFTDDNGDSKMIAGSFIVSTIGLSATFTAFSDFDLQLEGTGDITISVIPNPPDVLCDEWLDDWWDTTPGTYVVSGNSHYGLSFAGKELIYVEREGTGQNIITSGTPAAGSREVLYEMGSDLTFDSTNPFNTDETIFVIWLEQDAS